VDSSYKTARLGTIRRPKPAQFLLHKGTVRTGMHGSQRPYGPPRIFDYGSLLEITAELHPVVGASGTDLSFSSPYPHGVAGGGGGYDPGLASGGVGGASASGGGSSGGGGGHGGGGGGGSLPFTGLAVGAVAAAGSALTAAGAALRRYVRRRSGD
jgi:hypothetical protein